MAAVLLPVAAAAFWLGILTAGLGPPMGPAGSFVGLALGVTGATATALHWYAWERREEQRTATTALVPAAPDPELDRPLRWEGIRRRLGAGLAVATSFALLGAAWGGLRLAHVRSSPITTLAGHLVRLDGSLATDPEAGMTGWTAVVRASVVTPTVFTTAGTFRVHDSVWIQGRGPAPSLAAGDRVAVTGTVGGLAGPFGHYLLGRGIPATLSVDEVTRLGPSSNPVARAATALRDALRLSLLRAVPKREAGLVMGLALGDTSQLEPTVDEDFRATGLSHLTAVSGENVAMFLAPILGLAGLLNLGRFARLTVGVGAVLFFVILTRAEPSVLRAAFMAGLTMLGIFLGRPRSPPAIIGGAVLMLLAFDPTLVYAIGFQLSVAATAGMAVLTGPLSARFAFLPKSLALAAAATVGAQAGVTPLILFHFGAVPMVTLPANILAFPAVGPGMLLGLLAAALGLLWRPLGLAVGAAAALPLRYLEALADRLARSPLPSITSDTGHLMLLVVGMAVVAAIGWRLRRGNKLSRRAVAVLVLVMPAFLWMGAVRAGAPGALTATFFDVGQGDSALVRSPGGATVLIDGGPDPDVVATKLAALGIRRIDLMVATHPHADHVAGLPAVLARIPTALVLDPGCGGDSPFYAAFLRAVRAARVPVRHSRPPERIRVGDITLDVLGPAHCFVGSDSDPNNDSVVLRLSAPGASILFPGDAEQPAQTELLKDEASLLSVAVLKVPHHGGNTSLPAFFVATHARLAIVSVGPNTYGHPVPSVLATLTADGMRVVRTDRFGDVTVVFDPDGLLLESRRG
ncbi:MAG TPA: ComEC/Rec2 family competence protein [Actinomycetota bacterium]|nr:ComEC/Rec2 family competence protein [Actinomycetota bacterium]